MVMCSQPTGEPRRTNKYVHCVLIRKDEIDSRNAGEDLTDLINLLVPGKIEIVEVLVRYTNKEE